MAIIGLALMGIGGLISVVGGIWLLVVAFQKSVLWGLGTLFIPFVGLIFAIMNWAEAKKPFLISLGGSLLMGVGIAIGAIFGGK